jgi:hypothetical protein
MTTQTLTLLELNRATLARQYLLERVALSPLTMVKHLVGQQAQVPNDPYIGLWNRLQHFERDELVALLEQRKIVKASLMRCTIHLMAADDFLLFRLALQPALRQILKPFLADGRAAFDNDHFSELVRAYVREQPRTSLELRTKFTPFFPASLNQTMVGEGIVSQIPLVHIYPSGVWNTHPRPAYTDANTWIEGSFAPASVGLPALVLRYLAAFGPASVRDIQTWSRLTKLREVVESLRPQLRTFRDEQGRELFDLPDAVRPPAETPAPVRFLPEYDNVFLSHLDRSRIATDEFRGDVMMDPAQRKEGLPAMLMIGGFLRGRWGMKRSKEVLTLRIEPFVRLSPQDQRDLQEEAEKLARFAQNGTECKAYSSIATQYQMNTMPSGALTPCVHYLVNALKSGCSHGLRNEIIVRSQKAQE